MQIELNGVDITFQIQYTRGQKMELTIEPEGLVIVKAPNQTKEYEIISFVKKNRKKLVENQKRLDNRQYISSQKEYQEDENFLYLGRFCKLHEMLESVPEEKEEIQKALKKFYTKQTKRIVTKRVAYFETLIKVKAKSITVVDSPKTWGTCNGMKELTFHYKLAMADPNVLDYVVIHELCHVLHLNHDRSFWRDVGKYDKNYKAHQEYLARVGGVMTI